MVKKKKDSVWKGIILGLLIAVGGWAVFQLTLFLTDKGLASLGIVSPIWKYIVIIFGVVLITIIGWQKNFKEAVSNLVK